MFGRKKQPPPNLSAPIRAPRGQVRPPAPQEVMRVLHAFMAEPPPAGNPAAPPLAPAPNMNAAPSPNAAPLPPPPLAGGTAAFNISTFSGREGFLPNVPRQVPIPGFGNLDPTRMQAAFASVMQVISALGGNPDLQAWTPQQVETVGQNLEQWHAAGRLTEEQYGALRAALDTMTPV